MKAPYVDAKNKRKVTYLTILRGELVLGWDAELSGAADTSRM